MIVQIKMAKAENRSTEVCNWVLGDSYKLCLSNFSLSFALVAVVFCCTLHWLLGLRGGRCMALLKLLEFLEVKQDRWGHVWIAVPALFAVFISCQKMNYNLFLLAFVLGIGGAFQYGLQVSIINSPAEVSTDSSKIELPAWISVFSCIPASICNQ